MKKLKVFVHIVLFNSLQQHGVNAIKETLQALLNQEDFVCADNLFITIRDNGSSDGVIDFLKKEFQEKLNLIALDENFGFAAGQNFGVFDFLKGDFDYFLILNPDIKLESNAIKNLVSELDRNDKFGMACPKLLRADENLQAVVPRKLDAAGMYLTNSLRHFDRGSERLDEGQYDQNEEVFGGSGACLLVKRSCIEDLLLATPNGERELYKIFPQLKDNFDERSPFFDEAFFAYREDADLAWRSQLYGWTCLYVSSAVGYHRRVVLPENRASLPALINQHSVRNRFLLQINNYSLTQSFLAFFCGFLGRNILVIIGVVLKERSSLVALKEVKVLFSRAIERRKIIFSKAKSRHCVRRMRRWF